MHIIGSTDGSNEGDEMKEIEFNFVDDKAVCISHAFPKKFFVSGELLERWEIEVRPLTVTSFIKGVSINCAFMSRIRFIRLLLRLGFVEIVEPGMIGGWEFCLPDWVRA